MTRPKMRQISGDPDFADGQVPVYDAATDKFIPGTGGGGGGGGTGELDGLIGGVGEMIVGKLGGPPWPATFFLGGDPGDVLTNNPDSDFGMDWLPPGAITPAPPAMPVNTYGSSHTLTEADQGAFVLMDSSSPNTLTIPEFLLPTGAYIQGAQLGSGQTTIAGEAAITLLATPGLLVAEQYGTFAMIHIGDQAWLVFGRLTA